MLNLPYLDNFGEASFLERLDYIMTVFIGTILVSMPLFIVAFYSWNFDKLADTRFKNTYGSIYDGYKTN